MRFEVLGSLRVQNSAGMPVTAPTQRRLLGLLLSRPNEPISADVLADALWPDNADSMGRLHLLVHRTRKALGEPDRLVFEHGAYRLRVRAGELDTERFETLCTAGTERIAAGDRGSGVALLREALDLWRGVPWSDLSELPGLAVDSARLTAHRLSMLEQLYEAELGSGRAAESVTELTTLTREHPTRERFAALLMIALHRCGRQADALEVYRTTRRQLVDELGIEPGFELRGIEAAILAGQPPQLDREPAEHRQPLPVPAQLPPAIATFAGRREELQRLDDALARTASAIVISGPAGVGKTALAVHWARHVLDRFPDGQLHIDLCGFSARQAMRPTQVLSGFLRALGVTGPDIPDQEAEKVALYRSLLAERRLLIVLDNARDAAQVRPLLPGAGSVALVTSRATLRGLTSSHDAVPVPVGALSYADCHELLSRIVGRQRVSTEPAATAELIGHCGGLPLALRIMAANLGRGERSLAEFAAEFRVGDPITELSMEDDPDAGVGQAFALSYDALDEETRLVFRRLGLFPGPSPSIEAAAALAGCDVGTSRKALRRLENAHLIEAHGSNRYRLHDLLGAYALLCSQRDDPAGERTSAMNRLIAFYVDAAEEAAGLRWPGHLPGKPARRGSLDWQGFSDTDQVAQWLAGEHANILATVLAERDHPEIWRVAHALRLYFNGTSVVDMVELAGAGLASARAAGCTEGIVRMLHQVGWAHFQHAEYDQARRYSAEAERTPGLDSEPMLEAVVLQLSGALDHCQGKTEDAIRRYQRSIDLSRAVGYDRVRNSGLACIAGCHLDAGNLELAQSFAEEVLALTEQAGDMIMWNNTLDMLLEILLERGEVEQAAKRLRDPKFSPEHGNKRVAAYSRISEARIIARQGEHNRARVILEQLVEDFQRMRWPRAEAEARLAAAELELFTGTPRAGIAHAESALWITQTTDQPQLAAKALTMLATLEAAAGLRDRASDHARQALDLHRRVGQRLWETRTQRLLDDLQGTAAPAR